MAVLLWRGNNLAWLILQQCLNMAIFAIPGDSHGTECVFAHRA
jgi:hypothetical protein